MIARKQKFIKKEAKSDGDKKGAQDDDSSREEDPGDTNAFDKNETSSGTMEQKENKNNLLSKRPVIFICNDPYSKGLKPLKWYCHHFKLEKNNAALVERLKHINKLEVT